MTRTGDRAEIRSVSRRLPDMQSQSAPSVCEQQTPDRRENVK